MLTEKAKYELMMLAGHIAGDVTEVNGDLCEITLDMAHGDCKRCPAYNQLQGTELRAVEQQFEQWCNG